MVYHNNKCVLYTPITTVNFCKTTMFSEASMLLEKSSFVSSKGKRIEKPDIRGMTSFEADEIEKIARDKMKSLSTDSFPVKGVMLRGIVPRNTLDRKPLKYSFSYLISDSKFYDWTDVVKETPEILKVIGLLPFRRLGRVIIQTVEAGFDLHRHIDSIYSINSFNMERRKKVLEQYGIDICEFSNDINCVLVFLLKGDGIRLHCGDRESVLMRDDFYFFRPDIIEHSIDKVKERRVILRVEGVLDSSLVELIERNANINSEKVLVI